MRGGGERGKEEMVEERGERGKETEVRARKEMNHVWLSVESLFCVGGGKRVYYYF